MKSYYSKQVMEHFLHPRHWGKIKEPNASGHTENLRCGDEMKIYIKVAKKKNGRGKEQEYLRDIKFETLGCAAAIASSDMICDLARGKTLTEAKKIGFKDVVQQLGELPPQKIHCTHLAETALKAAILNYEKRRK